jgi:hypothetical protein
VLRADPLHTQILGHLAASGSGEARICLRGS